MLLQSCNGLPASRHSVQPDRDSQGMLSQAPTHQCRYGCKYRQRQDIPPEERSEFQCVLDRCCSTQREIDPKDYSVYEWAIANNSPELLMACHEADIIWTDHRPRAEPRQKVKAAIDLAAQRGHLAVLQCFIDQSPAWSSSAQDIVAEAGSRGHMSVVEMTLRAARECKALDFWLSQLLSALFRISLSGQIQICLLLVDEIRSLCTDPALLSKLEQAVLRMQGPGVSGALAMTATLWDCDVMITPIDAEFWLDKNAWTLERSLLQAARYGQIDTVKFFLHWGAVANSAAGSALAVAIENGHLAVAQLLRSKAAAISASSASP